MRTIIEKMPRGIYPSISRMMVEAMLPQLALMAVFKAPVPARDEGSSVKYTWPLCLLGGWGTHPWRAAQESLGKRHVGNNRMRREQLTNNEEKPVGR